jgi:Ca2+-binding RTX toxin-like protein
MIRGRQDIHRSHWLAPIDDEEAPKARPDEILVRAPLVPAVAWPRDMATPDASPAASAVFDERVPPLDPSPAPGSGITPNAMPTDDLLLDQWHLFRLGDLARIWDEYTGAGVHVGIYDDGVQSIHHDLDGNYDASRHVVIGPTTFDGANVSGADGHGTAVAGLIAAENDGAGTVGIAFGAGITGVNVFDPASALFINAAVPTDFYAAVAQSSRYDVVNNSWGSVPNFAAFQNLDIAGSFAAQTVAGWASAAATGRDGLGTIVVKSSGNEYRDSQGDGLNASRFTISVSAIGDNGYAASYSNHGAAILVGASGSEFAENGGLGIVTTDLLGTEGYNLRANGGADSDTTDDFGGTSAAGPIVAAVVALMLDANPGLGWRDVQNILAASATHTGSAFGATSLSGTFEDGLWYFNGADTWNGGGMHAHANYGYGALNAYNAVRMAEVWTLFAPAQDSANEQSATTGTVPSGAALPDLTTVNVAVNLAAAIAIEHVSLTVTFTHANFIDLDLYLVSPEGTRVQLLDGSAGTTGASAASLTWTFGIDTLRGETSNGTWTVVFDDVVGGNSGVLASVAVTAYGQAVPVNDVFHFTDEFDTLAALAGQNGRRTITDADGGIDWFNAAAVSTSSVINLNRDAYSAVAGSFVRIVGDNAIENAIGGDGNDLLVGNASDNELRGMRGIDTMRGGAGDDLYVVDQAGDVVTEAAGAGVDTVRASAGFALGAGSAVELLETTDAMGVAAITLTGNEFSQTINGNDGGNLLQGLDGRDFIHGLGGDDTLDGGEFYDDIFGGEGNDLLIGGGIRPFSILDDILDGGGGDDTLIGGGNGDSLDGGAGSRDLASYEGIRGVRVALDGSVSFAGDALGDVLIRIEDLLGSMGDDTLLGDGGGNQLTGGAGDDSLLGLAGNDTLSGGIGIDMLDGGNDDDVLLVGGVEAIGDILEGGGGNDRVQVIAGSGPLTLTTLSRISGVETLDGAGQTIQADGKANLLDVSIFAAVTGVASLDALGGNDTVIGSGSTETIDGGLGRDSIRAGNGEDVVVIAAGESLADTLDGGAGTADRLQIRAASGLLTLTTLQNFTAFEIFDGQGQGVQGTGAGAEFLNFATFASVVNLRSIATYGGADTILGSGDADSIDAGSGIDSVSAGNGDDVVRIGGSEALGDTLDGGAGTADRLQIRTGSGLLTLTTLENFTGFEILDGQGQGVQGTGPGAEFLDFSIFASVINVPSIATYGGADTIIGSGDADTIDAGSGIDSVRAGDGDDVVRIGASEALADTLDGGAGAADRLQIRAGSGLLTLTTLENFTGFEIFDGQGQGVRGTGPGAELLDFSTFASVINVSSIATYGGADTIIGSGGADTIDGGSGIDRIVGGNGADWLSGGTEADAFVFDGSGEGVDRIADFAVGLDDLVISAAGFGGGLVSGADLAAEGRFVANLTGDATSAPGVGQFILETDIGRVWWDVDGGGASGAVALADLVGAAGQLLGAADLVIIA